MQYAQLNGRGCVADCANRATQLMTLLAEIQRAGIHRQAEHGEYPHRSPTGTRFTAADSPCTSNMSDTSCTASGWPCT